MCNNSGLFCYNGTIKGTFWRLTLEPVALSLIIKESFSPHCQIPQCIKNTKVLDCTENQC